MAFGTIGLAVLLFLVPAIPSWHGDPDRDLDRRSHGADLDLPARGVRGDDVHLAPPTQRDARRRRRGGATGWTLRRALAVLGAATVVTALVAEVLVGSLEAFAEKAGLSDFFVSAVIVAIVGNAAEHGGAVVVAHRGKVKLAAEIAWRRPPRSRCS